MQGARLECSERSSSDCARLIDLWGVLPNSNPSRVLLVVAHLDLGLLETAHHPC